MRAEDCVKRAFRYYGAASAEHRINDIAKIAALLIHGDLGKKVCWKMKLDFYKSTFHYAEDGTKAAISRMLAKGQLIECKKGVVRRPNPGPSRECCYRVFSDVCLMDGPTYKEIGADSWPYTEYHTDQVVSATHELERRGLIQGCFGYYNKHGGGAKHWYPTGKSFPVSWLSIDRDGVLAYDARARMEGNQRRLSRRRAAPVCLRLHVMPCHFVREDRQNSRMG